MHKIASFFVLFCLTYAQPAVAQSATDTLDNGQDTLQELLITACRMPYRRQLTPEAISVVRAREWTERHARTAPEALQYAPAVFVQKTNHGGGSPFLRGLTGNQTLQLVDGVRLNNATFRYGPNQYFNTIDAFGLGRIEVLRGSGSVQFGSDALGGTIQAFTADLSFEQGWTGQALGRFATGGMESSGRGELGYSGKKLAGRLGLTVRNFGDLVGGDTTGVQSPSGYTEEDYDLKLAWQLAPGMQLTAFSQGVFQHEVPVYHKVKLENFFQNEMTLQTRLLHYVRLSGEGRSGVFRQWLVQASLQDTEEERRLAKNNASSSTVENDQVRSAGAVAQTQSVWSSRWTSVSGAEYYYDLVNSSRVVYPANGSPVQGRGLYPDGSSVASIGIFTLHTYALEHWRFQGGLRYNRFAVRVSDENAGEVKLSPQALVWNAAALWQFRPQQTLFAGAQTGFRAPNVDDLGTLGIVDFRYEQPNYDLKPEESVQVQVGYKYQSASLHLEAYWYQNNLRQLISRVPVPGDTIQGYPVYQKENVEQALVQGFETDAQWRFLRRWALEGALTYTYGHNRTRQEPLRRIPPLFGRVGLAFRQERWSASAETLFAGKQDRLAAGDVADNRIPAGGTPGWWVANVHASCSWRWISVRLSALNLFTEDYRTHGSGINGYGRSAWATLALSW